MQPHAARTAHRAHEHAIAYARTLGAAHATARSGLIRYDVRTHTRIDSLTVTTQATDADGMAAGAQGALAKHPLVKPASQHQVALAARGTVL